MHELSLAIEVCRIAEERLDPARVPHLRAVGIEVGDDANIEVENFRFCLEALLSAPPFSGARPVLETQPGSDLRVSYLEIDDDRPDD
jgi:Zn finger protein HypA/HybF involved in hydrogenase expression